MRVESWDYTITMTTTNLTHGDTIKHGQIWHKRGRTSHRVSIWLVCGQRGDVRIGATRLDTKTGGHVELTARKLRAEYDFAGISEPHPMIGWDRG